MRISDWSSDVCSSDLRARLPDPVKILLASDAWFPQVNGVVRTLSRVRAELEAQGHVFEVICPDQFRTIPCPSYPEIRLAILPGRGLVRRIEAAAPDAIHIATEGPIGLAVDRKSTRLNSSQ